MNVFMTNCTINRIQVLYKNLREKAGEKHGNFVILKTVSSVTFETSTSSLG